MPTSTQLKFFVVQQTFDTDAQSTIALIQDDAEKLHFVRYFFEGNPYVAKGRLEILETLGKVQ